MKERIKWPAGNRLDLCIPLRKITVTEEGTQFGDYIPSQAAVVMVYLVGNYASYEYTPRIEDNKLFITDNGELKPGVYAIDVRIQEPERKLRSFRCGELEIVRETRQLALGDFVLDNNVTLDADAFIFGEGPSAFEVAVRDGYTGTKAEWLESMRGKEGRGIADIVALPTGAFRILLTDGSAYTTPVMKGEAGVSIVDFTVSSITSQEVICTITMSDGTTRTVNLPRGEKGAKGDKGDDGQDGRGIQSIVLNADYTLTFNYTDGTSYTTPQSLRGEKGENGKDGQDGRGISSMSLDDDSHLTVSYTDGTTYTTPQSLQGERGVSITDFEQVGESATMTFFNIYYSNGNISQIALPKGEQGDRGEQGPQGPKGDTVVLGEVGEYKLYNVAGTATDGAMTQDATTKAIAANTGYYECGTAAGTAAKVAVGDNEALYTLQKGGSVKVKMTNANAAASGVTLKIGSAAATPLFYNGNAVSASNTWEAGEVISVYFDGTNYQATNAKVGSGKAADMKYDNSASGLEAENVQGALDELEEKTDVSVSGVASFEQGQIDDSGKDSTASPSYYIRTPASSPIPIISGQTMNLTFVYKNSSGTVLTGTTRVYRYLNGTFVSYSQTTGTSYSVVCDGTFNQLRVRFYRSNVGSLYPYCHVNYIVEKTIKEVAEQVDTNTADIASISANLQDISSEVGSMEGQTINKRQYTSVDLGASYYKLDTSYQTTDSYSTYGGIKVPVKRGDHITLYTIGTSGAAKCWGLVDEYRKVLSRSSGTNYLTNPAEIDVTRDCYLCANVATTKAAEKSQFKLIITSNIQAQIEGAIADLSTLTKRAPQFCNNPFPFKGETLKVLSLANSFAEDTSAHLEGMMDAAGLDKSKFCYYFTFESGATLEQYANNYVSGEGYNCIDKTGSYSTIPRAGNYSMPNSSGSLKKIVSQDWDLILLQQASTDAYEWSSYIPYITRLVSYIKRDCPKACIGFMLTWATTYTGETAAPSYAQRYEMNVNCAKRVLHEIGIDFIVAPGTAIQNARNTSLEDADHLLRDSRHLNYGVGRYVAGCAFFDAVIAPFYGVSIIGNSYTTSEGTPVTDENKLLCQQCGHAAVANMFEVTTGLETAG